MKKKTTYKSIIKPTLLAAGLALSGTASAGLLNADFSDGFNHWAGKICEDDTTGDGCNFSQVNNIGDYSGNFLTSNNSVTLKAGDDLWETHLYQSFDFLPSFESLSLSFTSMLTDPSDGGDQAYATLVKGDFEGVVLHTFNGTGDDPFSFSDLSEGQQLTLKFGVIDIDANIDSITISGISLQTSSVDVPEPSTFAMFSFALLALGHRTLSRKKKI